jgi:limonene-1,2-epoxide hydrolase
MDATADSDNAGIVEQFLCALQAGDLDAMAAALDEDLVYENVGFPTIRGRARTLKVFESARGRVGFEILIRRIASDGESVITERTDAVVIGRLRIQMWICGVFEVHEGRIILWRDYFDLFDAAKGVVRAAVGAVVPALRPKF